MTTAAAPHESQNEATILARLLGGENGQLPEDLARRILVASFSERDKARMHELAVRNQDDALTAEERDELHAFGRVGDMLALLKSSARRTLGIKPDARPSP